MLVLLCLPASLLSAFPAEDPRAIVTSAMGEVLAIADAGESDKAGESREARLRAVLDGYFDLNLITRHAIGPGWRQFSVAEQDRAVDLFRNLFLRTYASRLAGHERPHISYGATLKITEDRSEVSTTVALGTKTYAVAYRLERRPNGWRIYDVIVEGISFVGNYRAQFDELFQSKGAADVLRVLETKQTGNVAPTTLP